MRRTKKDILNTINTISQRGSKKDFNKFYKVVANLQKEMNVNQTKNGQNRYYVPSTLKLEELETLELVYRIALDVVEG